MQKLRRHVLTHRVDYDALVVSVTPREPLTCLLPVSPTCLVTSSKQQIFERSAVVAARGHRTHLKTDTTMTCGPSAANALGTERSRSCLCGQRSVLTSSSKFSSSNFCTQLLPVHRSAYIQRCVTSGGGIFSTSSRGSPCSVGCKPH